MCDTCSVAGVIHRVCCTCNQVKGPAPHFESRRGRWKCGNCDPESEWNKLHNTQHHLPDFLFGLNTNKSPKAEVERLGGTMRRVATESNLFDVRQDGRVIFRGTQRQIWKWIIAKGGHNRLAGITKIKPHTHLLRSCATTFILVKPTNTLVWDNDEYDSMFGY